MEIDNFDIFKQHLSFKEKTDRYIVHILRRPKDLLPGENTLGANEHQRLLRTYYVDSIEYLDKKIPAIKELCQTNRARAYILPQVRNNYECLLSLGEKVLETIRLGNYSVKPEHLLRSAYCEYHKSRDKKWILDLDDDCMTEYREVMGIPQNFVSKRVWTLDEVLKLVQTSLEKCGKSGDDAYVVKTKSGHHIITSSFNLQEAYNACGMMYEGVKKTLVEYGKREDVVGWLHKDGMSLLYCYLDSK